jgi:hypothetical protein
MAFDPDLNETVLFGGDPGTGANTWGWNGTTWSVIATTGPFARKDMQMAYDAATHSIVLFGGIGLGGHLFIDTWTFDGTWHKQAPTNVPTSVLAYGMAYDAANQTVVMTDGERDSANPSTWIWNGTNWHRSASVPLPAGSTGVNFPAMAYDATTGQVILFGGITDNTDLSTTWAWNGTTWTQLNPATIPPARRGAGMAFDSALGGVVMFGGIGGVVRGTMLLNDTWLFEGANWSKVTTTATPSKRGFPQLAIDGAAHPLLFGGLGSNGQTNSTWILNP